MLCLTYSRCRDAAVGVGFVFLAASAHAQISFVNLGGGLAYSSTSWDGAGGMQVGTHNNPFGARAFMWSGSAASAVDLTPAAAFRATGEGCGGNQQVGEVGMVVGGTNRTLASLWTGSSASWISLDPFGHSSYALDTDGVHQVGSASNTGTHDRPALWSGSAASYADLTPAGFDRGEAQGVNAGEQIGHVAASGVLRRAALWHNTAASFVNLNPTGSTESIGIATHNGKQVGVAALGGGNLKPVLWSGTADSYVNLQPIGYGESVAQGIYENYQVGFASTDTGRHAILWQGTSASALDLQLYTPALYAASEATSIWNWNGQLYVSGTAYNLSTNRWEAAMWAVPEPSSLIAVSLLLLCAVLRSRSLRANARCDN